jgi:hypothetical protein
MNCYITDILARGHADRLMADAAAARRARRVRSARGQPRRPDREPGRPVPAPAARVTVLETT